MAKALLLSDRPKSCLFPQMGFCKGQAGLCGLRLSRTSAKVSKCTLDVVAWRKLRHCFRRVESSSPSLNIGPESYYFNKPLGKVLCFMQKCIKHNKTNFDIRLQLVRFHYPVFVDDVNTLRNVYQTRQGIVYIFMILHWVTSKIVRCLKLLDGNCNLVVHKRGHAKKGWC